MGGDNVPGKRQFNGHFKAGAPISRTRRIFNRISTNKDYKFGELTSLFLRFDEDQDDAWQSEINHYYKLDHIEAIKGYVMTVLRDQAPEVSLAFEWVDPKGLAKVTMSKTGDAYTITIHGLRAPPD